MPAGSPWLLYCGLMRPHFPLIAPPEYYARYDPAAVTLPATLNEPLAGQHPVIRHLRQAFRNDEPLPEAVARQATASYLALITFLDDLIGRTLAVLDTSHLGRKTVVLYTSDHGEMAGQHGIWQKQCFYEAAVRVPLLLRVPEAVASVRAATSAGRRVPANVSLVDVLPTLLDVAGLNVPPELPGRSLLETANESDGSSQMPVFSEYHAQGMQRGGFMVKQGALKYVYYAGDRPQLFDTVADPLEDHDLINYPAYAASVAALDAALRRICDPEEVDGEARADQVRRRAAA